MGQSAGYRTPLMTLQDPEQTKVLLVTLPEPTPVTAAAPRLTLAFGEVFGEASGETQWFCSSP